MTDQSLSGESAEAVKEKPKPYRTGFSWGVGGSANLLIEQAHELEKERLREALRQWDCETCHGRKTVRGGIWEDDPRVPRLKCIICDGSGIHPIARAALRARTADPLPTPAKDAR